jgi:hypothetical protein
MKLDEESITSIIIEQNIQENNTRPIFRSQSKYLNLMLKFEPVANLELIRSPKLTQIRK